MMTFFYRLLIVFLIAICATSCGDSEIEKKKTEIAFEKARAKADKAASDRLREQRRVEEERRKRDEQTYAHIEAMEDKKIAEDANTRTWVSQENRIKEAFAIIIFLISIIMFLVYKLAVLRSKKQPPSTIEMWNDKQIIDIPSNDFFSAQTSKPMRVLERNKALPEKTASCRGKIIFFHAKEQYGYIQPIDRSENIYVHYSVMKNMPKPKFIKAGLLVRYEAKFDKKKNIMRATLCIRDR